MALIVASGAAQAQEADSDDDENGFSSHAREGHHRGQGLQMNPRRMIRGMTRRLDLDEVQSEQIDNIVESARPEFEALREKGSAHRQAMRDLDVTDADYGAKLQNLAASSGELAASSTELRGRVRAEIFSVLTVEQQEKWKTAGQRQRDPGHRKGGRHRNQPTEPAVTG